MKGLTHFCSAVCAATFIPEVVRMSASRADTVEGAASSFILLLAGAYGLLPDTMDFKLGQFFSVAEYEVDPDPQNPNPKEMCETFARAVKETGDTGKDNRIQFFTTQLGANRWRRYNIMFEPKAVMVQFNEIVSTSQIPLPGTAPPAENRSARVELAYELKSRTNDVDWLNRSIRWLRQKIKGPDKPPGPVKPSTVDIFGGTQFGFHKEPDGRIYFNWLPWHRTWSHSYVWGFILTLPVHAITAGLHYSGTVNMPHWWLYGLVAFLGIFVHITEDMTGHIGGSLFWPLVKTRCEGLELFKASDPRTNFSIIYSTLVLSICNLDLHGTRMVTAPAWLYNWMMTLVPNTPDWVINIFPSFEFATRLGFWGIVLIVVWILPLVLYFLAIPFIKKRIHMSENKVIAMEVADGADFDVD